MKSFYIFAAFSFLFVPKLLFSNVDTLNISFGPCGGKDSVLFYIDNPLSFPVNVNIIPEHNLSDSLRVLNFHIGIGGASSGADARIMSILNQAAPLRNQDDLSNGSRLNFNADLPQLFKNKDLILFVSSSLSYYAGDSLLLHLNELKEFVENGGTVIYTGGSNSNELINVTGLMGTTNAQTRVNSTQNIVVPNPEEPLFRSVNPIGLITPNFTYVFDDTSTAWIPIATCSAGTVIGYKPIGRGRVIYIGFDYWLSYPAFEQILINAIRSSSHAYARSSYSSFNISPFDSIPVYFYSNLFQTELYGDQYSRFSIISDNSSILPDTIILHSYVDPKPCPVYSLINQPCQRICISNLSTHSPDSIYFDYGDGSFSNQPGCYDYSIAGIYPISMSFCNSYGCTQISDTLDIQAIGPVDPIQYYYNPGGSLDVLSEVNLASIHNQSDSVFYEDFSCNFQAHLVEGQYYPLYTRTSDGWVNSVSVFLDANRDGRFTHHELISYNRAWKHHYDTISIRKFPNIAYGAPLRLRILSTTDIPIPFYALTNGLYVEVEDYAVVLSPNPGIVPDARYTYSHDCDGLRVQFIYTGSGAPDSLLWEFSDGMQVGGWQVVHTFPSQYQQWVRLTVFNSYGVNTRIDTLHNPTLPEFYISSPVVTGVPLTITVPNYLYADWWWWTFPEEPALIQDAVAVHTYHSTGDFPFTFSMHWNYVSLFNVNNGSCFVTSGDTVNNVLLSTSDQANLTNWMVYPNPFSNEISLSALSGFDEKVMVTVEDLNGRKYYEEKIYFGSRTSTLKIPFTDQGFFLLTIRTATGKIQRFKIFSVSK
jgi:PKD repeat protein